MSTAPTATRRVRADAVATRPEGGPGAGRTTRGVAPSWSSAMVAIPPVALAIVFATRWSDGWLLLLDNSPGPRSAAWDGPDLPVGVGLRAVVGLVTAVDPTLVGWLVPGGAVVAAYAGGVRLARRWPGPNGASVSTLAAVVGGCVAAANPFVASRFYAGQIGVLWGSAALWWLVASLLDALESDRSRSWIVPGVWLALSASATVHMAVIGVVPVIVSGIVAARRHGRGPATRSALLTIALGTALTAAWLVPTLVLRSGSLGEAGGERAAHAFASGGPAWTLWLRAAGGAAFWRPLPAESLTTFGVVVAAGWLATALAWHHGGGHSRSHRRVLLGTALVGIVAVYAGHGVLASAWSWSVAHLWPAGLLREPGKLAMLAVLAPACGAAVAAQRLLSRHRAVGAVAVAAVAVTTVGAWTAFSARLDASHYPAEWVAARAAADADRCPIAVLGDGAYTDPGFTGGRVVADPARGFLGPRSIVSNDAQMVGLRPRPATAAPERWAEATNARYLDIAATEPGPAPDAEVAAAAGVGWVFVDRPVDRPELVAELRSGGFEPEYDSDRATMWRVPGGCA